MVQWKKEFLVKKRKFVLKTIAAIIKFRYFFKGYDNSKGYFCLSIFALRNFNINKAYKLIAYKLGKVYCSLGVRFHFGVKFHIENLLQFGS